MVVGFIDDYRVRFGVEPICRVLSGHGVQVAPSGYYAFKARTPSKRALSDAYVWERIEALQADKTKGRGVAGYRKMWHLLKRDGVEAPRCQVARRMRAHGMQGVVRGRKFVTTTSDSSAPRPPDLVQRDFTATRPNELWIVDFTYVPTWAGMGFTAFVKDVYSRRIVGWRTHHRMPTELPLDALEMALWIRERACQDVTGLVHHCDAGSQGGFNWSSQHLEFGGVHQWQLGTGARRPAMRPRSFVGSGVRIGRYGRRCVLLGGPIPHGPCSGSSGG